MRPGPVPRATPGDGRLPREAGGADETITTERLAQGFARLFGHRVFRLELPDYYDALNEREPYARFLAGELADSAWREPWKKLPRGVRESGRVMERLHAVSEPVTGYTRFSLLHGHPANAEAGEDARVMNRAAADTARLPERDFRLLDDDLAATLSYAGDGSADHAEMTSRPAIVAGPCEARDKALALPAPLAEYVSEHQITTEETKAA